MKIMASNTDVSKIENGTEDSSSFHRNTSFVLLFVQFFGIMPLYGLSGRDERKIRFEWKSFRVLYSLYVALGAFVSGIFVIVHFCLVGVMMDKTGHIAFYFGNFFNVVILMRIARHWSTIVQKFSDVERVMSNYGKLPNLRRRFQIFIISTTFLALLEHSLFIVYQITFALKECKNFNKYPFEIYFAVAFPHFFGWLEFSYWGASLVEIANLWSTVVWNFTDIFLMVVSSGLAIRLKQVMDRLEAGKSLHEAYIVEIRQDYNKMCNLCQTVDSHIAPLVLVSYLNNVYFICVQLYNSIKPRSGIVESVYFFYSFGFILGRLIGVTLCASWLNDESQRPLKVLYSVPSEQYSKEVSRFIDQIASSSLGITGSKFFVVTRSFMLKIAGTIVTIELMLMQFGPLLRSNDPNYSVNTCLIDGDRSFGERDFCLARYFVDGLLLDKAGTLAFYICNFFGTIELIHIARKWHVIVGEWCVVEDAMKSYGKMPNLRRRFKIMTIIVMSLALIEHLLFVANALTSSILECENFNRYPFEIYFGIAFPHFFVLIEYSSWKAILVELANIFSTVVWNFIDLFIMLISSALAVRLKQIMARLQENKASFDNENFWKSIREDYNRLWRLCHITDKIIAPLVTISFISNLFFICVQLYNSMKPRVSIIETVYFFFSFGFLLGRTLAVSLYAAWINDESKKPLYVLYSIQTQYYCTELHRFIQQIVTCPFGITGSNFFTVTRSFTLQVAGTIVTFELMLLQFGPLLGNEGSLYTINVCVK